MKHLVTLCYVGLLSAALMPAHGQDQLTLRLDGAGDMALDRAGSGTSLFVPPLKRLYVASQAIGDQEASILVFEPLP
jgi:hypothetical protein